MCYPGIWILMGNILILVGKFLDASGGNVKTAAKRGSK